MALEQLIGQLRRRGLEAHFFESRAALEAFLSEEIKSADRIAFSGSMTLEELGLYDRFRAQGKEVLWHWKTEPENRLALLKKAMNAEVYLSSSNAITADGKLINVDGNGNRVAAMIFGIPKVILIVGRNKICKDTEEALQRIKKIATPKNAKRLGAQVPCIKTDCPDCFASDRLCKVTTIIEGKPNLTQLIVCLLDEDLGY